MGPMRVHTIRVRFSLDGVFGAEDFGISALLSRAEAESEAHRIFWQRAHECGAREKTGAYTSTYRYVHDLRLLTVKAV